MRLAILVIEDEPEVREALERDLESFADTVRIEPAEDVADAREVLAEIAEDGDLLALVLADHRLPGETGVDFLVELAGSGDYDAVRTVLLAAVRHELTEFVLATALDPLPHLRALDGARVMDIVRRRLDR